MMTRKWARAKQAGAHGLRRGAWYPVVNDTGDEVVVLDIGKKNVPVSRSMVVLADGKPDEWCVVQWEESHRGMERASDERFGLTYVVCPGCRGRAHAEPPNVARMICSDCGGDFAIDWSTPG